MGTEHRTSSWGDGSISALQAMEVSAFRGRGEWRVVAAPSCCRHTQSLLPGHHILGLSLDSLCRPSFDTCSFPVFLSFPVRQSLPMSRNCMDATSILLSPGHLPGSRQHTVPRMQTCPQLAAPCVTVPAAQSRSCACLVLELSHHPPATHGVALLLTRRKRSSPLSSGEWASRGVPSPP